ncbi:hypothetical protein D915_007779 [Fasciola hepatica]|uniref:Uncharacterized protein n=1 Tax=Fasciola hepatica TaxID=6192 RepID=A0A4E0RJP0_FASHE|nr:hypothetical protein D915_007779 [Fasciola hepatica]
MDRRICPSPDGFRPNSVNRELCEKERRKHLIGDEKKSDLPESLQYLDDLAKEHVEKSKFAEPGQLATLEGEPSQKERMQLLRAKIQQAYDDTALEGIAQALEDHRKNASSSYHRGSVKEYMANLKAGIYGRKSKSSYSPKHRVVRHRFTPSDAQSETQQKPRSFVDYLISRYVIERQSECPIVPEEEVIRVRRSIIQHLIQNGPHNILSSYTYRQQEPTVCRTSNSEIDEGTSEMSDSSH